MSSRIESIRNFIKNHQRTFLKFGTVGVVNTLIDFTVFTALLYLLSVPVLTAHICAFLLATVNSFVMNKFWTFNKLGKDQSIMRQSLLFLLVTGTALAVSSAALLLFSTFAHILIAKVLTICITVVWNYVGLRMLVFKS